MIIICIFVFNLFQKPKEDVPGSAKIPEQHFQVITAAIIVGAMVTGILVPNGETLPLTFKE